MPIKEAIRKNRSKILTFCFDMSLIVLAVWLTTLIFYPARIFYLKASMHIVRLAVCIVPVMLSLFFFGCFSGIWKYAGRMEMMRLMGAFLVVTVLLVSISFIIPVSRELMIDPAFMLLYGFIGFAFSSGMRFSYWFLKYFRHLRQNITHANPQKRAVIVGAGYTGAALITRFINNPALGYTPVAVIDDNIEKHGMMLSGVKVAGGTDRLVGVVRAEKADVVIIATSTMVKSKLKAIYKECLEHGIPVKLSPVITDKYSESVSLSNIKIEELLGRDEIKVRRELVDSCIKDKTVLITGGSGSIGSELCRQVLRFGCKHLIILDAHENGVFELDNELRRNFDKSRYSVVVGNIRDAAKLKSAFEKYKPQVVFHAAAYKHVPMMEANAGEAVKTNVFGTLNLLEICEACGAEKFIFISTDKAVNPANIMGATKRVAEMLVQLRGSAGRVKMAAVRFGNVVGSNGSAIPIFLKQIESGGPVTVTHKDIIRYFMTIPEAVSLVLQAGAFAGSGEVFVLDMGEPVRIYNLAEDLIRLSGYEPHKDIKIEIMGLREGEKLFEELRFDNEACDKTSHEGIFITRLAGVDAAALASGLDKLEACLKAEDDAAAAQTLFDIVPSEYRR